MARKQCIVLFVRLPEEGKVKSRLARTLGEVTAAGLYKNFVLDILDTLRDRGRPVIISCDPPEAVQEFRVWLGEGSYMPQRGRNLGEKMGNSFKGAFTEGFSEVLLMGSDIPDLSSDVIDEAFISLRSNDAVIGPAADGGYYLVGFRVNTFLPDVFDGIPWGSGSVFSQTMGRFEALRYRVHLLPGWGDVDTMDDLLMLCRRNKNTGFAMSRTMTYVAHRIRDLELR